MSSNTESSGTPTYKEVENPKLGQKYYYKNDTDNGVEYKESKLIFSEFNSAPGPEAFDDGGYYVYFMEDNPNRVRTSLYERVNGGGVENLVAPNPANKNAAFENREEIVAVKSFFKYK